VSGAIWLHHRGIAETMPAARRCFYYRAPYTGSVKLIWGGVLAASIESSPSLRL
jgi:hypothetical protein